jgi:metal-dependent hydrolase (beta-lactamase superfamily II)
VENSVHERGLKAEHGLAWHIQFGSQQVLFDTGQTNLLVQNARQLGISLDRLDAIVLSHGHYDHTGCLAAVVAASPRRRHVGLAIVSRLIVAMEVQAGSLGIIPLKDLMIQRPLHLQCIRGRSQSSVLAKFLEALTARTPRRTDAAGQSPPRRENSRC